MCVILVHPKHKYYTHRKQLCWHMAFGTIELTQSLLCPTSLSLWKGQRSNTSMFLESIFFKAKITLMSGGAAFYQSSLIPDRIWVSFFSEPSSLNIDFAT